jgi:ubiquinone/menaquinone biosynthesis C-methylase UbiE
MSAKNNQPDWDQIAEKFDMWLPQIESTTDALIDALGAHAGNSILDVASGTGEPALTLARRMGDKVTIQGIDAAPGMARVANLNSIIFRY